MQPIVYFRLPDLIPPEGGARAPRVRPAIVTKIHDENTVNVQVVLDGHLDEDYGTGSGFKFESHVMRGSEEGCWRAFPDAFGIEHDYGLGDRDPTRTTLLGRVRSQVRAARPDDPPATGVAVFDGETFREADEEELEREEAEA